MEPKFVFTAFALIQLTLFVSATSDPLDEASDAIQKIGAAAAVLMFSIQGLKWVTSETPADRAEAKKGMIYVIVGLIFLKLAFNVVCGVYGAGLSNYDASCSVPAGELKCVCSAISTTVSTTTTV
jgi:hypothetical protein